jgi:isopenicillin N synthase-like dioxygenase
MVLPSSPSHFVTVNPVPYAFTVNAGDYLSLITRGRVISPLHRVVTADEVRTSFVFFWYPRYEAKIPVMEEVVGAQGDEAGRFQRLLDRLSLFKDQTQEGSEAAQKVLSTDGSIEMIKAMSFGDYISAKWASVFRTGGYS